MSKVEPPMRLSVRGRRIKHRRRKIKVIKTHQVYAAKDCSCEVVCKPSKEPVLVIRVEVFPSESSDSTVTESMKFHLGRKTKVSLLGTYAIGNPYPYHIKWRLGKMRYMLKVCKLSLVSDLIALNDIFQVKHTWQ